MARVKKMLENSPDLSSLLTRECEKRGIAWDPISKEAEKLRSQPNPNYQFPEELRFAVDVNLSGSQIAYKNLVSGLSNPSSFPDMLEMKPYRSLEHGKPTAHPLRHFQFTDVIKEWAKADQGTSASSSK